MRIRGSVSPLDIISQMFGEDLIDLIELSNHVSVPSIMSGSTSSLIASNKFHFFRKPWKLILRIRSDFI